MSPLKWGWLVRNLEEISNFEKKHDPDVCPIDTAEG